MRCSPAVAGGVGEKAIDTTGHRSYRRAAYRPRRAAPQEICPPAPVACPRHCDLDHWVTGWGWRKEPGMGSPRPAEPAGGRPTGEPMSEARLILLAEPASGVERTLVKRWLREAHIRPSAVVPLDGPALARSLAASPPDTVITAARVARLPPERDGERRLRWADVVSQVNPRRGPALWQERIIRRQPGRAQLVVAEPATVAALRERWGGTGSFAQFVSRQARLALDRAERALTGYRYKVPRHVAEAIEDSPEFRASVAQLAPRLGLTEAETMARADADLDGLVASMSPVAVDLLTGALRPLHA